MPLDTGGKIRSYNLMRELGRRHEVGVFTFYPREATDLNLELRKEFHRVECVPMDLPGRASIKDVLAYGGNLLRPYPHSMLKYCRPEIARKLRALLQKEKYDAIICDFLLSAHVIPWDLKIPTVVFTHNVEAVIWRRHFEVGKNPFFRAVSWREWRTMARVEKMYLNKADHVLAVSQNDLNLFSEYLDPQRMTVIPTGVDTDYFRPDALKQKPNTLVFTGSMDWMPNDSGIQWFVREILPAIQKRIPDVRLAVVGRRPSKAVLDLPAHNPAVTVTGAVPDIRPYVNESAVYVVPLLVGGGTRIKIFEALAMGKAVVSTTIGAEGLPVTNGTHLELADSVEDFANATVQLLQDPGRRESLEKEARRIVEENYSWRAVSHVFDDVLDKVVPRSREASAGKA